MGTERKTDRPAAALGDRKSKKAKRKKGIPALLLGAIIGGALLFVLLCGLGVFAVFLYRPPVVASKTPSTEIKSPTVTSEPPGKEKKIVTKTHEEIFLAAIDSMRKVEAAFLEVKDAVSADKAADAIRAETSNLRRLEQEVISLGKASAAEKQRVNRHAPTITAVAQGIAKAGSQIPGKVQAGQIPRETALRLLAAGDEFGKAQVDFGTKSGPLLD